MSPEQNDLIILAADADIHATLEGLLSRPLDMGIRNIKYKIINHPNRDSGCYGKCHEFLRQFSSQYAHALVIFDFEGCGQEHPSKKKSKEIVEREVEDRLNANGWDKRSAVVVLDPELEIWVWSDSRKVETCLGWKGQSMGLKEWLVSDTGLWIKDAPKPHRPKDAMANALRKVRKPQSASIFNDLAKTIPLTGCLDKSFEKFRQTMQKWFKLDSPDIGL
ncbi:MAG: hypothetical protein HZB23_06825 [Deltaproteobacteria bacterium]|nr:hypothetical protein [Deltaproteobacteria bacterium]